MKRRDFFKTGARRAAGAVVDTLADSAEQRAASWIRPPFAKRELDFLLACTRCDDCVAACPHDAVESVKNIPNIRVLTKKGGCGVVREFIDLIIKAKN